jgi:hypothetical protein
MGKTVVEHMWHQKTPHNKIKQALDAGKFPIKLRLHELLCPGDILVFTPTLTCLHEQYKGLFETEMFCNHPEIFDNNPYVVKHQANNEVIDVWLSYPLVNRSNQETNNFMEGYCRHLESTIGMTLRMTKNKPMVYLTDVEKREKPFKFPYALINSGWKNDYTTKSYPHEYYREIVRSFPDIKFIQIGMTAPGHNHKPLDLPNVTSLFDKTNIRDLLILASQCAFGVGPITALLHCCAAFDKNYFCTGNASEPMWWSQYHNLHKYNRIGLYKCALNQSCWKTRVSAINDGQDQGKRMCELPVYVKEENYTFCQCSLDIDPQMIVEDIRTGIKNGGIQL